MNTKRITALFVAILMLVCLFSACASNNGGGGSAGGDGSGGDAVDGNVTDGNVTDGDTSGGDTTQTGGSQIPVEEDIEHINYMAYDLLPSSDNYKLALDRQDANLMKCVENQHLYGIEVDTSFVANETYSSVIVSSAASGTLPEAYFGSVLDDATYNDWINRGMFLSMNEVMEHSSGNMVKAFGENGCYAWGRAVETINNDWYGMIMTNGSVPSIQIQESDGPLRMRVQMNCAYALMIRQDWLDKLELAMPTNPDEYFEACLAMNTSDTNENGLNDERIIIGLGTAFQYQGIGQWYGLSLRDFLEDPSTGEIEVNILKEGFAPWVQYMNRMYSNMLVYNNEGGHPWVQYGPFVAENNVISWFLKPDTLWSTGRSSSGDPNCNYQPMPIIAAIDGVKPRVVSQEANGTEWSLTFNESMDPQKAAKMADCIYSYEQYLLKHYGIEHESWEYAADGSIIDYTTLPDYVDGDIEYQYRALSALKEQWSDFMTYFPCPAMKDMWEVTAAVYTSHSDALAHGEPYAASKMTMDTWMSARGWHEESPLNKLMKNVAEIGDENINWACYYSYPALATEDELMIQSEYGNELSTYLQETSTKFIIGDLDISELQSTIDFAYENLYLEEYIEAQQHRVDRFLEAIGR